MIDKKQLMKEIYEKDIEFEFHDISKRVCSGRPTESLFEGTPRRTYPHDGSDRDILTKKLFANPLIMCTFAADVSEGGPRWSSFRFS